MVQRSVNTKHRNCVVTNEMTTKLQTFYEYILHMCIKEVIVIHMKLLQFTVTGHVLVSENVPSHAV